MLTYELIVNRTKQSSLFFVQGHLKYFLELLMRSKSCAGLVCFISSSNVASAEFPEQHGHLVSQSFQGFQNRLNNWS